MLVMTDRASFRSRCGSAPVQDDAVWTVNCVLCVADSCGTAHCRTVR